MVTLKEITSDGIKNGYSPNASDYETGYWVLGLGALGDGGLIPTAIKPVEPTTETINSTLRKGDFLISRSNTPDKVGRAVMYRGEIPNCSYPDLIMRFRVSREVVSPEFLESKLQSHAVRSHFRKSAAGSSGSMVKINKKTVESTPLALPPLPEQRKIAKILSTWGEAITATERLLANSEQQKKALMQQLLTGKKRLPGFEGRWKEYSLGELFEERNESGLIDLPLLSITAQEGVISREDVGRKDTSSEDKSKYRRICPGDIGYNTMRMWQGVSGLSDIEGIVSPAYTILKPASQINSQFAAYLFKLPDMIHVFYRHSQGLVSDTWNLKYKNFSRIKTRIPSLDEQKAIANVLASSDKVIQLVFEKLEQLKREKKALIQQLLTGKRRVDVCSEKVAS